MGRSFRNFVRSEAFDGRDIIKELRDAKEKAKKDSKALKTEADKKKKENMRCCKVKLELAHRKAFIEHYLRARSIRQ